MPYVYYVSRLYVNKKIYIYKTGNKIEVTRKTSRKCFSSFKIKVSSPSTNSFMQS